MNDGATRGENGGDESSGSMWTDLVRWIQGQDGGECNNNSSSGGGYVHPSLALRGRGPSRGVVAEAPIAKGELLIRIRSKQVLSGENEPESEGKTAASPWLKCVGAFLRAKRNQSTKTRPISSDATATGQENSDSFEYRPYLNSLPTPIDYETLHNWSTNDEVIPYLKGTTLGNLVALDRTTKGVQTRFQDSVEPYLRTAGAIDVIESKISHLEGQLDHDSIEKNADYQSFLEASMCISTRGFHLLPSDPKETGVKATVADTNKRKHSYDGPFLLPVIDLLNHDPQNSCTTLRRHRTTGEDGSCFVMVAEREIAKGEEIFHSYGSDLTSAQMLQTFGFVPGYHTSDALVAVEKSPPKVSLSRTPVGLRTKDHLIAATRSLKTSIFPDMVMDRMRAQNSQVLDGGEEEKSEEDCFWEVCDIPDRSALAFDDEFLVLASPASEKNEGFLLTEDMVTLLVAQFLPEEAFEEIFPLGNVSNTVRLDRSILMEDEYLGMLVCKSVLVAIFLKAREYCKKVEDEGGGNSNSDSISVIAKAISGGDPAAVGRYLSTLMRDEAAQIKKLLEESTKRSKLRIQTNREIYGRTIRLEELTNLFAFYNEIEGTMATLHLGGSEGQNGGESSTADQTQQYDQDLDHCPPHKRAKVE